MDIMSVARGGGGAAAAGIHTFATPIDE